MVTAYANTLLNRVPSKGGSVHGTLSSNVYQGNDGTSLPCSRVFVQGAYSNAGPVMMNVGAAATSILGVFLPVGPKLAITVAVISAGVPGPVEMPIDDVSSLYFWGTSADQVNILYLK